MFPSLKQGSLDFYDRAFKTLHEVSNFFAVVSGVVRIFQNGERRLQNLDEVHCGIVQQGIHPSKMPDRAGHVIDFSVA
jgi:hypothetical protein